MIPPYMRNILERRLTGRISIKPRVSFFLRRRRFELLVEVEDLVYNPSTALDPRDRRQVVRHWRELEVNDLNGNHLKLEVGAQPLKRVSAVPGSECHSETKP